MDHAANFSYEAVKKRFRGNSAQNLDVCHTNERKKFPYTTNERDRCEYFFPMMMFFENDTNVGKGEFSKSDEVIDINRTRRKRKKEAKSSSAFRPFWKVATKQNYTESWIRRNGVQKDQVCIYRKRNYCSFASSRLNNMTKLTYGRLKRLININVYIFEWRRSDNLASVISSRSPHHICNEEKIMMDGFSSSHKNFDR